MTPTSKQALVWLCAAIALIYIATRFKLQQSTIHSTDNTDTTTIARVDEPITTNITGKGIVASTSITAVETSNTDTTIDKQKSLLQKLQNKTTLPGTTVYPESIQSLETLALNYEHILQDNEYPIYYAYLTALDDIQLTSAVQQLEGNMVTIDTDAQRQEHELFGDSITFINLPNYQNKIVLMLVAVDNNTWFIQTDIETYYQTKTHMAARFSR